jgi:parallel beta-helix repeat protein
MKVFLLSCALIIALNVSATNYYFSTTYGNDNRTAQEAQNASTPWKSIDKLNKSFNLLNQGDIVHFQRGDIFYGSIDIKKSGTASSPIVFTAYGSGKKPVISGLVSLSDWISKGSNVFEATQDLLASDVNMLLINGTSRAIGRYPNLNTSNKGYLQFQSSIGNTSITDNRLTGLNFNEGEIVIRKNRWVVDRNKITQHAGGTINYISQSGYPADKGYGYFIQNHPATLDAEGEWYYNAKNKRVGIYTMTGNNGLKDVRAAAIDILVAIENQTNITLDNLTFEGSNKHALYLKNADDIKVINCDILFSGANAVTADNTTRLTIENSVIEQSNNIAFNGVWCTGTLLKNNRVNLTGAVAGMGLGDAGSYEAIMISGNNNLIEQNQIDSTGYIPITFNGNDITVRNNNITNYAFVKDDGGGIYTWNNGNNAVENNNRTISGNIISNGIGAGEGTNEVGKKFANGIYIDDNAANIIIDGNTAANCASNGVYIHNARNISVSNNTVYNNQVQLAMVHDDIAPNSPVKNNIVTGNILFSLSKDQPVAEYKTRNDDLVGFGSFSNNYYCRPIDDNATINVLKRVNGNYQFQQVDLEGWKSMYGKDANSKTTARQFAPFKINQLTGGNQFSNGSFNSNAGGLYAYAPASNCNTTWNNGTLDGGTLQVAFSNLAGNNNKGTVIIGVGKVTANKKYVLSFSLKGSNNQKMIEVFLRKSLEPYNDLTSRQLVKIKQSRQEISILFVPTQTQENASIGIDVPEQVEAVFLDNIQLREVNATETNVSDSVRFVYNETNLTKAFSLGTTYIDVKNKGFNSSVALEPHTSAILLQTASAIVQPSVQCSATGSILYEQWDNVAGNNIGDHNFGTNATASSELTSFEKPPNVAEQFASRLRGYICPPQTGTYTFWIAGDDATELYLSKDEDPSTKSKIAYNLSWTGSREWDKFPTQKSAEIYLEAGKKYYIEALHKEGDGGDNLAVAWQLPSGELEAPIQGNRLSPFSGTTLAGIAQTITFGALDNVTFGVVPFTLSGSSSSGLPLSFKVVSGPATIQGNKCTITGTGAVTIEASQPGNNQYKAAPIVTRQFTVLAANICAATGKILFEQWNNVEGNNISDNDWNKPANSTNELMLFESQVNNANSYASRIRGYICPPVTGTYIFWIAGDDATELYISTDDDASNKKKIAYNLSWTGAREWNKFSTQKSQPFLLEAGKKYYVEAVHKEGNGGDNLAVAWQLPDGVIEGPIPGKYLSPFSNPTSSIEQSINFEAPTIVNFPTEPFTLSASSTSGLQVSFKVITGPATLVGKMITINGVGRIVIEASQDGNAIYNSAPPVQKTLSVLAAPRCAAIGYVLHEYWNRVSGNNTRDNDWNSEPDENKLISSLEGPSGLGDNYASRISGYICPPLDGNYTFWISGDDATELYLSDNESPSNKSRIAYNLSWTGPREWNKFTTQQSAPINLKAGKKYYIEAIHKEGAGEDNISVAWQLPNGSKEMPIPGSRLSPFESDKIEEKGTITSSYLKEKANELTRLTNANTVTVQLFPNPVSSKATIQFNSLETSIIKVELLDLQGRTISQIFFGRAEAGSIKSITFNSTTLPVGQYVIRVITGDKVLFHRFVVAR